MNQHQSGFRQDGRTHYEWRNWVDLNRDLIAEAGLPVDVVSTRSEFEYLLMHGYNRAGWWNEQPWYEVGNGYDKSSAFWRLLDSYVTAFSPMQSRDRETDYLWQKFGKPTEPHND